MFPKATISKSEGLRVVAEFRRTFKASDQLFKGVLNLIDAILPEGHKVPKCTCLKKELDMDRKRSLNTYSAESIACMSAWQNKSQNVQLALLSERSKRWNGFSPLTSSNLGGASSAT